MKRNKLKPWFGVAIHLTVIFFLLTIPSGSPQPNAYAADSTVAPAPLLEKGHPVEWWFVFKFNSAALPGCGGGATRACLFGGDVQDYKWFGQQYVYASSEAPSLQEGSDCAGDTTADPIGATFDQVYSASFYYVIWNDQFYKDPPIKGCSKSCGAPWGHSKGMLVWNEVGEGFVLQVTTPSWPASGNRKFPRKTDGNTLGCVKDDNVEPESGAFREPEGYRDAGMTMVASDFCGFGIT